MATQHETDTSALRTQGLAIWHDRSWRWVAPLLVAFLLLAPAPYLRISVAWAAGGVDTTCTPASIQSDLTSGGAWTLACAADATTIPFSAPVTLASGTASLQVSVGRQVVLDGGHRTRLFTITGGTLSLS